MPIERTYSPQQLAEMTGKGYRAVMALIKAGELPATDERSPGASRPRYRVTERAYNAWRESRRVAATVTLPATPLAGVRRPSPSGAFGRALARERGRQTKR